MIEFSQGVSKKKSVRLRFNYNGQFIDFCGLGNEGLNYMCDLKRFKKKIDTMTVKNFNEECFINDNSHKNKKTKLSFKLEVLINLSILLGFLWMVTTIILIKIC